MCQFDVFLYMHLLYPPGGRECAALRQCERQSVVCEDPPPVRSTAQRHRQGLLPINNMWSHSITYHAVSNKWLMCFIEFLFCLKITKLNKCIKQQKKGFILKKDCIIYERLI